MRIASGAGHGGNDPGAVQGNDVEREYNRVVNQAFLVELKNRGVDFKDITVDKGYPMSVNEPVALANAYNADLAIQWHFNAGGGKGVEVLCWTGQSDKDRAAKISAAIAKALVRPDRGAKSRTDLGFIKGTTMPAIIIEVEFIDSPDDFDETIVKGKAAIVARATADAILGTSTGKICPTCGRLL